MNTTITTAHVQMHPDELKKLVTEVKETVATDLDINQTVKPTFSEIDIWNIRRSMKTARMLWNK